MVFKNFVWEDHSLAHRHQNQMTGNHPWDRLDPSWLDPAPWFDGCVCLFHSSDPTNLAYHIEPLCWHSNSTWHPLILYKIDVHSEIIRYLIHYTASCICYKYIYPYIWASCHSCSFMRWDNILHIICTCCMCINIYIYNIHTGWIWEPNNSEVVTNHLGRGHVSFEEGNPNERHAKNLMIRENRQPRGISCMFCMIPEGHA